MGILDRLGGREQLVVAECDIEADLARGQIFYAFMQLKDRRLSHPPGPATATHHITILAHSDTKTDVLITCASLPVSRELRRDQLSV